ncbi:MAG: outer membrane lipoprotein LolB [Rhodoferax sp.]|uniref:lipoprotein insertase outer membrane protein LolB n=1 Tax=Rhodoferax sp. TaxID=50421 RepID=UPI001B5B4DEF|nr:lipoprotein insertase outer membrane protein LolB [Rhodoferax sp.]MBP9904080.1 outer membrane lipoprotein LolB [Rhodoferax sp.]
MTWSGKLSLRIPADHEQPDAQAQVHNAGFDLQGDAQTGQLRLTTPLGTTAALVDWMPHQATLTANGVTQSFADLNTLSRHLLGTHVPVASFFDWLAGQDRPVDGWTVDLSQQEQGKITARRNYPAPSAELRLLLEP